MERLTSKQYISLCLAVIVSMNFIALPYISTNIIACALGALISLILLLIYKSINLRINLESKFISSILLIRYIVSSAVIISLFCKISEDIFIENCNEYILLLFVFAISIYCGKGNSAFILSRIIYIFVLFFLLFVAMLSFRDIKFNNILYDFNTTTSINPFIILSISFVSLIFEFPAVLLGMFNENIKTKTALVPVIIGAIFNVIISVCITGRFGSSNSFYKYPAFELLFSSDISGYFIQRQQGVVIPILLMTLMLFIGLNIFFTNNIKKAFNFKYLNYYCIFFISLIITFFNNPLEVYVYSNIIGGIAVMAVLFLGGEKINEN